MTSDQYSEHFKRLVPALAQLDDLDPRPPTAHTTWTADAEALSNALLDIAESAKRLATAHVPAILSAAPQDLPDLLHACREELRHICHHVADSAYLRVIMPPVDP